jgi:hypothetical protein
MANGEAVLELSALEFAEKAKPAIKRLSHTHEDIARWLLENPTRPLKECAMYFQYTQAWLSCIIHSDAFQARLKKLQDGADAVTILDVPARLRGVAAHALEGLGDQVETAVKDGNGISHRQFLLDASELALKALGYGVAKAPPAPGTFFNQTNYNFPPVDPVTLARARERIINNTEVSPALPEASQLPASGDSDFRQVQRLSTLVSPPTGPEGPETSRPDL